MKSRSTEKKRKGSRIQSFKKREIKGGMLYKFDINNPIFQDYTDTTFSPSYACDFNMDKNNTVITAAETLKQSIMAKLVEFAFTNNSASFVHTIQCCFGLKGHSASRMPGSSNVSSKSNTMENHFSVLGTDFLFSGITFPINSGDNTITLINHTEVYDAGTTTLFHIAAAWGNYTMIEILLNIGNNIHDYKTDPIITFDTADSAKISQFNYTTVMNANRNPTVRLSTYMKSRINTILKSLYSRTIPSNPLDIQNDRYFTSNDNPVLCELFFAEYYPASQPITILKVRADKVNTVLKASKIIKSDTYELIYENDGTTDVVTNLQYMPFMSKCTDEQYKTARSGKFCPYVASGITGTSSATSFNPVNRSETSFICDMLENMVKYIKADEGDFDDDNDPPMRVAFNAKICDILAHYAFRDDKSAFNQILACAQEYNKDNKKGFVGTLASYVSISNKIRYSLLHIGAIYGNIDMVQPLIQLYKEFMEVADLKDYIKNQIDENNRKSMLGGANQVPAMVDHYNKLKSNANSAGAGAGAGGAETITNTPLWLEQPSPTRTALPPSGIPPPPTRTALPPSSINVSSTLMSQVEYPSTPSVIECLYTRSDINLDIFYGSMRKSTPSDSFAVQEYFKELIDDDGEYTAQLKDIYKNNGTRILYIFNKLNNLDASSWTSKKSILTPIYNESESKIEYVQYIQSANVKLLGNTTKFAIATGAIVSAIAAGTTIAVAGVAMGTTYLVYTAGKGLVTATWNGTKWVRDNYKGAIDGNDTTNLPTNTDGLEQMARVATDDEITKLKALASGDRMILGADTKNTNVLVIKGPVKWVIINNVAYDIGGQLTVNPSISNTTNVGSDSD